MWAEGPEGWAGPRVHCDVPWSGPQTTELFSGITINENLPEDKERERERERESETQKKRQT